MLRRLGSMLSATIVPVVLNAQDKLNEFKGALEKDKKVLDKLVVNTEQFSQCVEDVGGDRSKIGIKCTSLIENGVSLIDQHTQLERTIDQLSSGLTDFSSEPSNSTTLDIFRQMQSICHSEARYHHLMGNVNTYVDSKLGENGNPLAGLEAEVKTMNQLQKCRELTKVTKQAMTSHMPVDAVNTAFINILNQDAQILNKDVLVTQRFAQCVDNGIEEAASKVGIKKTPAEIRRTCLPHLDGYHLTKDERDDMFYLSDGLYAHLFGAKTQASSKEQLTVRVKMAKNCVSNTKANDHMLSAFVKLGEINTKEKDKTISRELAKCEEMITEVEVLAMQSGRKP